MWTKERYDRDGKTYFSVAQDVKLFNVRNFPLYIKEFVQNEDHPALQLALKMHELQGIMIKFNLSWHLFYGMFHDLHNQLSFVIKKTIRYQREVIIAHNICSVSLTVKNVFRVLLVREVVLMGS